MPRVLRPAWIAGCSIVIVGLVGGGCAAHQTRSLADRLVIGRPDAAETTRDPGAAPARQLPPPGAIAAPSQPAPRSGDNQSIETEDPPLRAALAALARAETAAGLERIAEAYFRLGVFDSAHRYLTRAMTIDPRRASLYDLRARVWRDWGSPDLALGDAHRSVFLAARSAASLNTLGTVLFALGRMAEARATFEQALGADPSAAWIENNLCYVALAAGDEAGALTRCSRALDLEPGLTTARNNLALVHAAAGRLDEARAAFLQAGPRSAALYNMGIVFLARRDYTDARESFEAACRDDPSHVACARVAEARALAERAAGVKRP